MRNPVDQIEDELVAKLQSLRLDRRGLPEVLLEYDRLESETAERLREHSAEHLVIDLQRTLAAARLSSAKTKHADTTTAAELFKRSNQLGYDTPGNRLVAAAIFARICLRNERADLGVVELEDALQVADIPATEQQVFEALLEDLRASQR